MRMGQGVRTGLGHGGITCVLQTQFSSFFFFWLLSVHCPSRNFQYAYSVETPLMQHQTIHLNVSYDGIS